MTTLHLAVFEPRDEFTILFSYWIEMKGSPSFIINLMVDPLNFFFEDLNMFVEYNEC